jgi:hypothetical protein
MEESIKNFRDWLSQYQKDDPWLYDKKIDRELSNLYRYNKALKRKAAIGVYGQSQSGKSFLIDSLLNQGDQRTVINVGQKKIRFDELNPDQGAEATAVTCRFTKEPQNIGESYIRGELHSVGELVRILFAAILELDLHDQLEKIDEYSFEDEDIPSGDSYLNQYQIFDLLDHIRFLINETIRQPQIENALKRVYSIIENKYLNKLSFKTVEYLISFLWSGFSKFEQIVNELFELYAVFHNREEFLLHENLLKHALNTSTFRAPKNEQPKFSIETSSEIKVNPEGIFYLSILQIACSELIFPVANNPYVIDEIDLLDFPGLRPLAEHNNLQKPNEIEDNYEEIINTIKQGKLKATFYLYSKRVEIPSLLLVTAGGNQEAQSLPKLVNKWIQQNCSDIGEDIDSEKVNRYLFTAMTKTDMLFRESKPLSEDDVIGRIQNRFSIHFENFFNEFLSSVENYDNVFMAINKSADLYTIAEGENKQLAKNIFINHDLVQKYLGSRVEETFDALYRQDGGVDLLKDHLISVSKDMSKIKIDYLNESISGIRKKVLNHANNYLVNPNDEEQLNKERDKAKSFANLLEENKSLYSILSHYQSYYFPDNVSFRHLKNEEDPLRLGAIFDDQNSEKENFKHSYHSFLDTYFNSLTENQENYIYYKDYLSKIESAELNYYFTKIIEYLKHNESLIENIFNVYNVIDVEDKYQKRAFIQYLKYVLVSEITGYRNLSEAESPHKMISTNLEKIYTSSIPDFDEQANKELETIINSLSQN